MGTSRVNPAWRALALGVATTLATVGTVGGLGASVAHAAEQTYTHGDGATVTYDTEVVAGEAIVLTGTNWMTKEGHSETQPPYDVFEGDEGSIIGVKFMAPSGNAIRREKVVNPWNGDTDYSSGDVWDIIQAAGTGEWWDGRPPGSWEVEIPWPTDELATNAPDLQPGDTFSLQFLSGSLYGNIVSADPAVQARRPDVSRTINLEFTVVGDEEPTAPLAVDQQPEGAGAASGGVATFTASTTGGAQPVTVQWQRSTSASATTAPANYTNLNATNTLDGSFAKPTLTFTAGSNSNLNNRWYRAVFTDAEGATVTTSAAKLSIVPAPTVTLHPNTTGQTIDEGQTATFTADATSAVEPMTVQWQSTRTTTSNGEPDATTWVPVPDATAKTLSVEGTDSDAQHGTFYRAGFTNVSGTTYSYAAELRFFDHLNTNDSVTVSGESYGPVQPNQPFSVSAPNAVVKGQPIVITGSGYLATDGTTGSVANFMVDASYSGDPNTLNTTRDIINPVTGTVFADKRSHGIVQANADGTWQISIPWPDETNTTRDAAFFQTNWVNGTQHIVRILTGSLLTNPADYQRGISVRFTIVDEPTGPVAVAPEVTTQPSDVSVAVGQEATFTAAASGEPTPTVQWQSGAAGGDWTPVDGATETTLTLSEVTPAQSGTQYRALFTNSAGTATSDPATLTVQDPALLYTTVLSNGQPAGTLITPREVVIGEPITISGTGWLVADDSQGSGGPVFINQPSGGTGPVTVVGRTVENQIPGSTYTDARAHGVWKADENGDWSITIPFPTPANSSLTAETAWQAGQEQTVRILTGSLVSGDRIRTVAAAFTIVATPDEVAPRVSASVSGRTVTVTATDEGSGVDRIETRIDDGDWQLYEQPFEVPGTAGHRVEFRATDLAGNVSTVGSVTIAATEPTGSLTGSVLGTETTVLVGRGVSGFGVALTDEGGAAVRGVPVTFAIAGSGAFPSGVATTTVATNAAGIAVAPTILGQEPSDITVTATWEGGEAVLPPIHVVAPASDLAATVQAVSAVVAGKVEIAVTATNTSSETVTVVLKTRYGSRTFTGVAPGETVSRTFKTYLGGIAAGTATATLSTATGTATVEAPYDGQ